MNLNDGSLLCTKHRAFAPNRGRFEPPGMAGRIALVDAVSKYNTMTFNDWIVGVADSVRSAMCGRFVHL